MLRRGMLKVELRRRVRVSPELAPHRSRHFAMTGEDGRSGPRTVHSDLIGGFYRDVRDVPGRRVRTLIYLPREVGKVTDKRQRLLHKKIRC